MNDLTLTASDIHCGHCKTSLETAVGSLEGVSRVEVSIEDRTIGVEFADGATREEIVSAVEGQGYDVD